jgi:ribonuclease HI
MISYTINTDASYSHKYKRGAWAYWIKGQDFHVKKSGMFEQKLHSSFIAELLTFEKALQEINKVIIPEHRSAVMLYVNSDSKFVLDTVAGTIKSKSRKNQPIIKAIQHVVGQYNVVARHVKAHTGNLEEPRSWVNDWCDRAARAEMGKAIYDQ